MTTILSDLDPRHLDALADLIAERVAARILPQQAAPAASDDFLDTEGVCVLLKKSRDTIERLKLPRTRVGGTWRYRRDEVLAELARRQSEPPKKRRTRDDGPAPVRKSRGGKK